MSGIVVIDGLDAQQGEVAFVLLGRPDLPGHDGPGAQAEPANLARRDVDVVGAGQVIVIGAAQEAEAVGQDFERAFAEHQAVLLDAFLEDLEDQILLFETGIVGKALVLGPRQELRHGHLLQFGDVRGAALDLLVAVVGLLVEAVGPVGRGDLRHGSRRQMPARGRGAAGAVGGSAGCWGRRPRRVAAAAGVAVVHVLVVIAGGLIARTRRRTHGISFFSALGFWHDEILLSTCGLRATRSGRCGVRQIRGRL